MDQSLKSSLEKVALAIRSLSIDAIEKANSGHPGLPMGCAEIGSVLYGSILRFNPEDPQWLNRDRFVLSAGHGSMFLYSLLHLSGYDLPMNEIKNFRQLHSKTPGHPEVFETFGVEMTTGPLGQGLATAVGMALGLKMLGEKLKDSQGTLLDCKVFTLAGDGCIMEGVASEASSFAGHNALDNLVILYDANQISLDGPLGESFSEDVAKRYEAYGFEIKQVDGHDFEQLHSTLSWARKFSGKPKMVICKTIIGKGSPNRQGTNKVHGSPLGEQERNLTRKALGIEEQEWFYVPDGVYSFFESVKQRNLEVYASWNHRYNTLLETNRELARTLEKMKNPDWNDLEAKMPVFKEGEAAAGRKTSSDCLQALAAFNPGFIGGSADLSCSDSTFLKDFPSVKPGDFKGRNIKYGVREFAMGAIQNGLSLTGYFTPYCGTFLTFSDYLRPAIRLAALIGLPVSYQFTHDSVLIGEDGPTHQPVEHAAALRAIPNLLVFRPADGNEVRSSWVCAMKHKGPRAFLLTRQNLKNLACTAKKAQEGVGKGAYVVLEADLQKTMDRVIYASGSELSLALELASVLKQRGENVRVVSVPCFELFEKQEESYKQDLLSKNAVKRLIIEAQCSFGWHRFAGFDGQLITMDRFGASAPDKVLAQEFGFTVDKILAKLI